MVRAVNRLWRAIRGGEPICVWGDFDVDGQTATALLVATLRDLGAHRQLPRAGARDRVTRG